MNIASPLLTRLSGEELNRIFEPLAPHKRLKLLYDFFPQEEIMATSSFGINSAYLLHLFSRVNPSQPIHFIDTTYHFPGTLAYKEELTRKFELDVRTVLPHKNSNDLTRNEKSWENDPNFCCTINKVIPLEEIKAGHRVWVSGLIGYQSPFRKNLRVWEVQDGIYKFYPLVDVSRVDLLRYLTFFNIPEHPLKSRGYGSVGCTHCTAKGKERNGRWNGKNKIECGLHLPKSKSDFTKSKINSFTTTVKLVS